MAVPRNTHFGMLFFVDYMESAFANVYAAFEVLRAVPTDSALRVLHCESGLDRLDDRGRCVNGNSPSPYC